MKLYFRFNIYKTNYFLKIGQPFRFSSILNYSVNDSPNFEHMLFKIRGNKLREKNSLKDHQWHCTAGNTLKILIFTNFI